MGPFSVPLIIRFSTLVSLRLALKCTFLRLLFWREAVPCSRPGDKLLYLLYASTAEESPPKKSNHLSILGIGQTLTLIGLLQFLSRHKISWVTHLQSKKDKINCSRSCWQKYFTWSYCSKSINHWFLRWLLITVVTYFGRVPKNGSLSK